MNMALRGLCGWIGAAVVSLAGIADDAGAVEVDLDSYQGRTEAAIAEFRAAVALEPNLTHGKTLFAACAQCHQADGSGSTDGTIPVIAGQHVSVVVKQLVDFRHDRRWHAKMRAAVTPHALGRPQDLLDVAAYAESLPRPAPQAGGMGDGQALQQGRVVYYRDCESCHGRLAEGDLQTLRPRLAGQHYAYLLRQLNETAAGQRPGMDDAHVKRIGALSEAERAAVADHLSRLSPGFSSIE
jgi:cytochrome c553